MKKKIVNWQKLKVINSRKANFEAQEVYEKKLEEVEEPKPDEFQDLLAELRDFNFRLVLTEDEAEILKEYVLWGDKYVKIADRRNITEREVKKIFKKIRIKLLNYIGGK